MNLNNPQAMAIPRQNSGYPMAQLRDGRSGGLYNFNQPTEVIGGYDTPINPMTGQEIPQVNFAKGGITSVLESKGRRGDTMLVHMAPEEVQGLQRLAMAHGGTLTINPETGLYEASFLKKILPTIIGAMVPSIPGLGTLAKTIGFGNATLGTGLLVGGATALIEGDLKKGLQAGLGAYSGANIAQSLRAASDAASQLPQPRPEELEKLRQLPKVEEAAKNLVGASEASVTAPLKSVPVAQRQLSDALAGKTLPGLTVSPLAEIATNKLPPLQQPSLMGGIKSLFTSPEARSAFGQALGGGFESPFMQNIAKTATFSGIANALSPEPQKLPTGGAMGEDIVYIPGGFNPLYGQDRTQPYQLPGKYYKRTPQGLVPYNPFALAPGGRGFADGGIVDPARDPGGNVLLAPQTAQTPFSPYFTNPVTDPNVAATRSYIEDLNRRARSPEVVAYPGVVGSSIFNRPGSFTGYPGGVDVGGGDVGGAGVGDIAGAIAANYLIDKGIEKGVGYLKDKFFQPEEPQGLPEGIKDPLAGVDVSTLPTGLPALTGADFRTPNVTIEELGTAEVPGEAPVSAPSSAGLAAIKNRSLIDPLAGVDITSLPSSVKSIADLSALGSVPNIAGTASSAGLGSFASRSLVDPLANVDVSKLPIPGQMDLSKIGNPNINMPSSKIIPGIATALGAYETAKAIEAGKEGRAAFSAAATMPAAAKLFNIGALGGPAGILAAAAIAAIGASLVNTKEFGDKALENYWKAVDGGRGIGQTPPEELAQGFINFYRTNKNEFAGQEKYGRTGNEDFVYDMTQVINDAVKSGKIEKGADAATIYANVVQPWLNSMGPGPQDADARRVQDFMMTDLIHNFMKGAPISNAQVKGDKNYKMVSERPVYAGQPPEDMQMYGKMPVGFEGRPGGIPEGAGREGFLTPFSEPEMAIPTRPTMTPFSAPQTDQSRVQEILANAKSPIDAYREIFGAPRETEVAPVETPFSAPEQQAESAYYREPEPVYQEPEPVYRREYEMFSPFAEFGEGEELRFNYGGAVGEGYNFGFAQGGMPNEYQAGGKLLDGPGDGMSDDIPAVIRGKGVQRAALADGEFVIPADVVSHLGNGSTKAGAKKLYDMMARVRQARTGNSKQAPAVKTARLLPA